MDKTIKEFIDDMFDFENEIEYIFRKCYGLTFVFRRDITYITNLNMSVEIYPAGIIYTENDEYYFAPLHGTDEIDEIVKEYVKKI